jgi:nitroreductase
MELWDAIRSRRNVREFDARPVAEQDLERIVDAGRLAPSARNWQPWDFVVVTEQGQLERLAGVWQGARHVAGAAAAIAIISPEPEDERWRDLLQYDIGQATAYMLLAAAELGIGTGHASVADQALARELLGFPDDHFCAYLLSVGYPAGRPLAPLSRFDRRSLDDVLHRGRW